MEEYYSAGNELYDISSYLLSSEDLVVFSSMSWDKTREAIIRLNTFLKENEKSILAQKELLPTSEAYSEVCDEFNNYILKDKESSLFVVPYLLMTIYDAEDHPVTNVLFETIETKGTGNVFDCNCDFLRLSRNIKWVYLISISGGMASVEDIIYIRYNMRFHNSHPKDKYCLIIDDKQKMYESPVEYFECHSVRLNTLFEDKSLFSFKKKYTCDLLMWDIKSSLSRLYKFITQ